MSDLHWNVTLDKWMQSKNLPYSVDDRKKKESPDILDTL